MPEYLSPAVYVEEVSSGSNRLRVLELQQVHLLIS